MAEMERRQLLQILVAAGVLGSNAAGAQTTLTPEILQQAQKLLDQGFEDERLRELLPSIQRNLDFFQIVRDEVIEDRVEPAPTFRARMK